VTFSYDHVTGVLVYDAIVNGLGSDRVVALTVQRGDADQPGPILAHLLLPEQTAAQQTLTFRGRDREDLVAGEVYMHLYTRPSPLGVGRAKVSLSQ
jgi:amidase